MLLKACLAHGDPVARIREYGNSPKKGGYGHDIRLLWKEFKSRQGTPVPSEFDAIVEGLHKFEEIRYPEKLVQNGATISLGPFECEGPPITRNGQVPKNSYVLMLPQIDRLVGLLFDASGANPLVFLPRIRDDEQSMIFYNMVRQTLLGRPKMTPQEIAAQALRK
jgi:hypothetical protein